MPISLLDALRTEIIFSHRKLKEEQLHLGKKGLLSKYNMYHRQINNIPKTTSLDQRVIVKSAYTTPKKLQSHLKYLSHDGIGIKNKKPGFFSEDKDKDLASAHRSVSNEKRFFKFIISPENADKIDNLKIYTRDVMRDLEKCIKEKLQWHAVIHKNTGNPHIHIVVRGITKDNKELIIDPRVMSRGFRSICVVNATSELGYRTNLEKTQSKAEEIHAERLTSIDRILIRRQDYLGFVSPNDGFEHERLKYLEKAELVDKIERLKYKFKDDTESKLKKATYYNDIIKNVYSDGGVNSRGRLILYEKGVDVKNSEVIKTGFTRDFHDKPYAVLEKSGKHIYIEGSSTQGLYEGQKVKDFNFKEKDKNRSPTYKKANGIKT